MQSRIFGCFTGNIKIALFIFLACAAAFAEITVSETAIPETAASEISPNLADEKIPFTLLFNNIDPNALYSFGHNYGFNYITAGLSTYALVQNGTDWKLNRISHRNDWLVYAGMPSGVIGMIVPIALPLSLYFGSETPKTQITGLAIGQAALISVAQTMAIKAITARKPPGIGFDKKDTTTTNYSDDFMWFGVKERGVMYGYPSSHTAVAFSMAGVLLEMYPSNAALNVAAYSYAFLIGAGMSVNGGHWLSEVVAGALIGNAIGRTVGKNFAELANGGNSKSNGQKKEDKVQIALLPNGIYASVRF